MPGKILVADDDASVQRSLAYTLRQEGYEVIAAGDGPEALRLWAAEGPILLIVDAGLPKSDGYAVAARIRAEEGDGGHVPIVLLTSDRAVEQKVRALRAGADDYLVKPFHPAELLARVKGLLARYAPRELATARKAPGRVSAFYGAKGGAGTTTVAINTAIALHRELGKSVALIDGDLQFGDHRVFLDLGLDRKGLVDVVSAPHIDEDLLRRVLVRHDSGIELLLAPPSPEAAELVRPEHMPEIIEILRGLFDHVVVDIDQRLDETNLRILDAADTIYVVLTADLSCLKNVRLLLETIVHLGYPDAKVQLVLNRSNAFTGIGVKNAESALRREIAHQIVNEYRGAISALNSGEPFMVARADSPLARSVLDFARAMERGVAAPKRIAAPASPEPARK
ncbi:MAG TPA: response regulator [Candidatus Limnocylindrales bacterium]